MDAPTKHQRSWSIQSALDQHGSLKRQREMLVEVARSRVLVRQSQQALAEERLEEVLRAVRSHVAENGTGPSVALGKLTRQVRAASAQVAATSRAIGLEMSNGSSRLDVAVKEIAKSHTEMRELKRAIDDKNAERDRQVKGVVNGDHLEKKRFYCSNCKVGGHGTRFCEYLLKRPNWYVFPHQKWFSDERTPGGAQTQYYCPLGKHIVDFVDETQFSGVAMYLKGRIWLEEKTKVFDIVPETMPPTYVIEKREWTKYGVPPEATNAGLTFGAYEEAPADQGWWEAAAKEPTAKTITDDEVKARDDDSKLPWFLKEADRNWGTSVRCFATLDECMRFAKPDCTYVVQRHIARPLLYEGRKAHIKFYIFVYATAYGKKWSYFALKDGYLSIAPHPWSPLDVTKDMQVTIVRSQRIHTWKDWEGIYPKCRDATKKVFRAAVESRKLEGRDKPQFEIMSADYIVDEDRNVYLLEFNTSPVLKDPKDSPDVNDGAMITAALGIVFPWEGSNWGKDFGPWELADEFEGPEYIPDPKEKTVTGGEHDEQEAMQIRQGA